MDGNSAQVGDRGVGLPFGMVINGDAPCRGNETNAQDPTGGAWRVRCFLTGLCVPAAECVLGHGGRFYHATMLSWWLALCNSADDDRPDQPNGWEPETGASTYGTGSARIVWEPWMASVPPRLMAHCGAMAIRSMSASAWARGHVCQRTAQDLVRLSVLNMAKVTSLLPCLDAPRGVEVLVAATATIAESSAMAGERPQSLSSLSPLLRSFDMVTLKHVELVHPTWDHVARGSMAHTRCPWMTQPWRRTSDGRAPTHPIAISPPTAFCALRSTGPPLRARASRASFSLANALAKPLLSAPRSTGACLSAAFLAATVLSPARPCSIAICATART
ncbi:F-box domain protein [Pandoravirus inopinatum]|uniref:F-box domain protein n=1 Tax=Pandoravirus inopinatum TaxID=1605721 RepID=A0A0B5JBW0_9VIRU|nr:F-box domain protein [Pandoravirus inopinatum]AJF97062.1 F-box domain protein [Pandoravirus inopinatum]